MFLGARNRAAKRGLEFSIDIEDIVIPDTCPILKIPLVLDSVSITRGSPSLDRIDNTKGYVKGNVQVISHKANTAKNDLTPEDLMNLAKWVQEMFA